MPSVPKSAADALTAYRGYLKKCRSSNAAGRCGGSHRRADGARLAALYAELERTEPVRDREARVDALLARYRATTTWTKHTTAIANTETATAKRSGTAVKEANNACQRLGSRSTCHTRGQPRSFGA